MSGRGPRPEWGSSRRTRAHHRTGGPGGLTPEQQALAEDLHMRAAALRAASDGDLSIREAVDLAAHQLGIEAPQTITEEAGE